jgi:hypothetical protein
MFNINGIDWEIKFTSPNHPKLYKYNGTFALGSCDNLTHTIYISENVPMNKLRKVLCHEVTHAAMFSYRVELDLSQEELIADLIATYGSEIISVTNRIFSRIAK